MPRKVCEWSEIEPGNGIYNTCKEDEEFHLSEGLELYPYCHWCGGKIKVTESSEEMTPNRECICKPPYPLGGIRHQADCPQNNRNAL